MAIELPRPPFWRLRYLGNMLTQAARDFTSDASNYILDGGSGPTLKVENAGAGGAFEFAGVGLDINGGAGLNVSAGTRDAPLAYIDLSTVPGLNDMSMLCIAMDLAITIPGVNTGAAVLLEITDQQNSSRNFIGDVGGTDRISSQYTIGGSQSIVPNPYDPPGGHPATVRLVQISGLGGDRDFYGDGGALAWPPSPKEVLLGVSGMQAVTDRAFGWDVLGQFDPAASSAHLVFAPVGAARVIISRMAIWSADLSIQ